MHSRFLASLLKELVGRAADPWALLLAAGAAAFGLAIGANPLGALTCAVAILVVHRLAVDASVPEEQQLTRRQLAIAHHVAEGANDKKIAGNLGITEQQVEKEVRAILLKIRRTTRPQIKNWYRRHHGDND
jgi:DNA-binding CsgD family transcriptional regulator